VDQLGVALQHGIERLYDERYEATAQLYFSPSGTALISALWHRALLSLERPQKKVCVIDLDNTLWGGILGEDGPDALQMADSGMGMAFRRFQRSLMELKRNGVLLAVCSKNNLDEAMAVLRSHPDCLLRPVDFAHIEIGWGLKSEGIERAARKLRLGLDSFVFIDDSPAERAEVAQALPMVDVLPFPSDPLQLVRMLTDYSGFDALRRTAEDRSRADAYVQEVQRTNLRESATSPEDFYRSLGLRVEIFIARPQQSDRLHQLLMKTNQFNLTAERLSPEDFRAMLTDSGCLIVGLRVSDRFGDSGITGLAIVDKRHSTTWTVRNFLLSCRVIGRTVEHAFVAWLVDLAAASGVDKVQFRHLRTERNQVAREFLEKSGAQASDAGEIWTFDVTQALPPHFVRIENSEVALA
jgi:FkbH-like protein